MKRIIALLMIIVLAIGSNGCAKIPTRPDEGDIAKDLQSQLNEYQTKNRSYPLDITQYEITKSLTEDKTYSAEIDVIAKSNYAEFTFIANVEYSLYDQGWDIVSCQWEMLEYTVVEYPSKEEVLLLEGGDVAQKLKSAEFIFDGDLIVVSGVYEIDWSPYVIGTGQQSYAWRYDVYADEWDLEQTTNEDTEFTLTAEFANALKNNSKLATWESDIVLTNISDISFDVRIDDSNIEIDNYHIELEKGSLSQDQTNVVLEFQDISIEFYLKSYRKTQKGTLSLRIVIEKVPTTDNYGIIDGMYDMRIEYYLFNNGSYGADIFGGYRYHVVD